MTRSPFLAAALACGCLTACASDREAAGRAPDAVDGAAAADAGDRAPPPAALAAPQDDRFALCDRKVQFVPAPSLGTAVLVDDFGAAGDGVTHDEEALIKAIVAAGPAGTVVFTAGKTYVTCRPLTSLAGQTWTSTGAALATLKRCDVATSALVQDAEAGATTLKVADGSLFTPGMWISVQVDGTRDGLTAEVIHHPVLSVSGNTLTIANGLSRPYLAGSSTVLTSFHIAKASDSTTLSGLRFDGNRAHNDRFLAWQEHTSLQVAGADVEVRDCAFVEAQGDAVGIGLRDARVHDCVIERCNGSAFHLSGAVRPRILRNVIRDTNLQALVVGHAEAAVTWSIGNTDVELADNCIERTEQLAFGVIAMNAGKNRGVWIHDNAVRKTGRLLAVAAQAGGPLDLVFERNVAQDCGDLDILNGSDTTPADHVEITDNRLSNSHIQFKRVAQGIVRGNEVRMLDPAFDPQIANASNQPGLVTLWRCEGVRVESNLLEGGRRGIFVANMSGVVTQDTRIRGNQLLGQTEHALTIGNPDYLHIPEHSNADLRGVLVQENLVVSEVLSPGGVLALVGPGARVLDNCMQSNAVALFLYGHAQPTGEAAAQAERNVLVAPVEALKVRAGQVADLVVRHDVLTTALPALLTAAGTATVQANAVEPGRVCVLGGAGVE